MTPPADRSGRRDFLKQLTALGFVGFPAIASAVSTRAGTAYDPAAHFEITVRDVEFRRTAAGRQLMARIYQPQGAGPFPTMLDLHGGAWNAMPKNRWTARWRPAACSSLPST
jgi:acetyl esterase/lipase